METILKNRCVHLILFLGLILACNNVSEFNQYKSIANNSWAKNDTISFQFEIKDTISPKNLFINIRNNSAYEFSNLYVITTLKFPDNKLIIDTLQYKMADVNGRFLGEGFSEIKENKLFYKERKVFPNAGFYHFKIRQAMRKNGVIEPIQALQGIQDVGLSIEKTQ
ncbi:gliding motility lipoprotein GldH [uncultured Polaribacter sp.]|uniref:gliding motility lipoprotein GldH n=1 Tax=uncultured Polaribacter sp. TaxID=174711 RepID=UPI002601A903|nr:gliding motility lipoprotein GldH [uncultured Polaribacter sp.]